jgi:hypothetical protein
MEKVGWAMNNIANKLKVGTAACAIAAAASLTPVATAQAAPVTVPATPAVFGSADAPLGGWWWFPKQQSPDLLLGFKPFQGWIFPKLWHWGCYGKQGW